MYAAVGDVLALPMGPFVHRGVWTGFSVIAASRERGAVAELSWTEFADGRQVRNEGYYGKLRPLEVIGRARAQLGRRYDLFAFNCDHLVRLAHGLKPESPQVRAALVACFALAGLAMVARR